MSRVDFVDRIQSATPAKIVVVTTDILHTRFARDSHQVKMLLQYCLTVGIARDGKPTSGTPCTKTCTARHALINRPCVADMRTWAERRT